MKSKIKLTISIVLIVISVAMFSLSLYIKNIFGNAQFEQLLMSLLFSEGTSDSVIISGLKYCVPITVIVSIVLIIPFAIRTNKITYLKLRLKEKYYHIQLFPLKRKIIYSIIIFITFIIYSLNSIGFFAYIKNQSIDTTIYADYYIDPNTINIDFPEKKQNLIYIYLESMEMSYNSFNYNGEVINLISNLEKIAKKNINFSNTNNLGGAKAVYGTTWTIAGTVAQTAGIPLKLSIDGNTYDHYNGFLPGVVSLGDILDKAGYNQVYMVGSDVNFAGRGTYFTDHGNYIIKDYSTAKDDELISEDYFEFWGYEDKKLFEYAKEVLTDLSSQEEPFNFTMLTVDTHAIDGYLDDTCKQKYDYQYADVISCSDSMISEFIKWLEKQDFYKDTTIILTGDHLTMQGDISEYILNENRTIYNAFINSKIEPINTNNRTFTTLDMFPTTLASLGAKIEGERLGLGTNLFSNKKTLAEELGIEYLHNEFMKNSNYYNLKFLKDTYLEMLIEEQ